MERILIYIKHNLKPLWRFIELSNDFLFLMFFESRMEKVLSDIFRVYEKEKFEYKRLDSSDSESLYDLIQAQPSFDLQYFHPHEFDLISVRKQFDKNAFIMMGVFDDKKLIGYFFLRCFINKKCFVGRLIDKPYRGSGIGQVMNSIMYETAWSLNFRCLSTICTHNESVMKAHARNPLMKKIKELENDYILVEFIKQGEYVSEKII